ncbi:ABC-three component system middle component 5 [Thioclava sp. 'Guangxiensis']|uniref:ABC-three component system middle component 5 n=1 Tax=Thioclava sp. 'Guangxiensis' TaxID=3149044 RepID=UPI003877ED4D
MTQLSYQPAFDPFNAVFRGLQITQGLEESVNFDAFRICDFFFVFPFFLAGSEIRYKQGHQWLRSVGKKYADRKPYGKIPDRKLLFQRVHPFQVAAISSLAKNELIDHDAWVDGEVKRTDKKVPSPLLERIELENERNEELVRAIKTLIAEYDLQGENGLKHRTGLLEYRYDAT